MIETKKIRLRAMEPEDLDLLYKIEILYNIKVLYILVILYNIELLCKIKYKLCEVF